MTILKNGKLRFSVKVTLSFCLFFSFLTIVYTQKQYYNNKRMMCQLQCQTASLHFQSDISKYLLVSDILESMLIETDGNLSRFDTTSELLIKRLPAIERLQLAPKGIITRTYPEKKSIITDPNLFNNPSTNIATRYALQTKKSYLSGPVTLEDGKKVLIIQQPVFLTGKNHDEDFWGFSILFLKLSELFSEEHLNFLDAADYYYSLWKPGAQTNDIITFARNTASEIKNPCKSVFYVSNSAWTLYAAPKDGWLDYKILFIEIIVFLVASLAVSFILAFLLSVKDQEDILERLSYKDSLTNLYNARKFITTLKEFQKKSKPYSLIYLDLNDFKQINDNLGHETGDQVLTIAARKLSNCIRQGDMAFRIGGDEFTIILAGENGPVYIEDVISRIKESVNRETVLKTARLQIQTSAGYARYPEDGDDYEEIIKKADSAMYSNKRATKAAKSKEKADK